MCQLLHVTTTPFIIHTYIFIYYNICYNKLHIFELSTVYFRADTKCQAKDVRQKKILNFDQLLRPAVATNNVLATSLITLFSWTQLHDTQHTDHSLAVNHTYRRRPSSPTDFHKNCSEIRKGTNWHFCGVTLHWTRAQGAEGQRWRKWEEDWVHGTLKRGTIWFFKSRNMQWAGHVGRRHACKVFGGQKGKNHLQDLDTGSRIMFVLILQQ